VKTTLAHWKRFQKEAIMRGVARVFAALAVVLTGLNNLSSVPITAGGGNSHDDPPTSLVGAWSSEIDSTLLPNFLSLGTFSSDGTLTNISVPSLAIPTESPGYGVWVRTGRRRFAVTFLTVVSDGAGNLVGTNKVRATLTTSKDGDQFTGPFQVDVFDAAGGLVVTDVGTINGTRIKIEPL
jgi:hypothetical protein